MPPSPRFARCRLLPRASMTIVRSGVCGMAGVLLSIAPADALAQTPAPQSGEPKAAAPSPAEPAPPEVVVHGQKTVVRHTLQGTAYSVADSAQGAAGSAVDVLNTLPSVRVAPDGSVTVRGSDSVRIFVNGRPSAALNGAGRGPALEVLAGGTIASVEVLTNPSVRDDANGGTILNIVLNKPRAAGVSGKVSATVGDRGRRTLSVNAGLNRGRVKASLDAGLRQDVRLQTVLDDRRLLDQRGDVVARFVTDARYTPTRTRSANLAGSLTYALPKGGEIGVEGTVSHGVPINHVFEDHRDTLFDGEAPSVYRRVRSGTYANDDRDISLFYRDTARDDRPALSIDAQHSVTGLRSDRPFVTSWTVPDRPAEVRRVVYRTQTVIDRIAADRDMPIAPAWRLRVGGELRREASWIANGAVAFDPAAPSPLPVPTLARFDGVQRIAVFHGAATYRKGDWAAEAGSRIEDVRITMTTAPDVAVIRRTLGGFAYRLSVTRAGPRHHVALRLSRSRERLDPSSLSPVVVTIDPQRQSRGNPLLRPQDVTTAEIDYGIDRAAIQATATLFLRRTDRLIGDLYAFAADGLLLRASDNTGRRMSTGGEATVVGKIGKGVKVSVTATLQHDWIDAVDGLGRTRSALLGYGLQASVDWDATTRDALHIDADRRGPELLPQGRRSGTGSLNMIWRHTVSPRLTASLTARGLVQDSRVRTVIRNAVLRSDTDAVTDTRAVMFGVSVTR